MNVIEDLIEYFKKFPGVGPKQAGRFVYYLLRQNPAKNRDLSSMINQLHDQVCTCNSCYQYFILRNNSSKKSASANDEMLCEICGSKNRDHSKLMIVSQDVDVKSIEKSGVYNGLYFVLGGLVPIMFDNPSKIIRINQLIDKIKKVASTNNLNEIIFALSANPEGENTTEIVKKEIENIITNQKQIRISMLGRGLSTGTEIEYSDKETLRNALNNRF